MKECSHGWRERTYEPLWYRNSAGHGPDHRNHLEALNADGQQHARKIGKEWDLDETAIRCLDEIRGLTRSEAIQNLENAEIRALTEMPTI